jgi:hypothetical protein
MPVAARPGQWTTRPKHSTRFQRKGDRPFLEISLWLPCHPFRDDHVIPTLASLDERDVIFLEDPRTGSFFLLHILFSLCNANFWSKNGYGYKGLWVFVATVRVVFDAVLHYCEVSSKFVSNVLVF